jgi:hypothetical protein
MSADLLTCGYKLHFFSHACALLLLLLLQAYARAVRNCPWVGGLWASGLRAMERTGAPDEQHAALAERALAAGMQVSASGSRCWMRCCGMCPAP